MNTKTSASLALILFALLFSAACPMVDSNILQSAREYFPDCIVIKPRPDVILVQTKVGGITQKFAGETFRAMLDRQGQKLSGGLALAGYRFFMLGFKDFIVIWDTNQPQIFWVFDYPQYVRWWRQMFGALPQPSESQRIEE